MDDDDDDSGKMGQTSGALSGMVVDTWVGDLEEAKFGHDVTGDHVKVLQNAGSGWTPLEFMHSKAGAFSVDKPEHDVLVLRDTPSGAPVSSSRTIDAERFGALLDSADPVDLGIDRWGRKDAPLGTPGCRLSVTLPNARDDRDYHFISSVGADNATFPAQLFVQEEATPTVHSLDCVKGKLTDTSKGDRGFILESATFETATGQEYEAVTGSASVDTLVQQAGTVTDVTASIAPFTSVQRITLRWGEAAFTSLYPNVSRADLKHFIGVFAHPGRYVNYDDKPDLINIGSFAGTPSAAQNEVTFADLQLANPFPQSWRLYGYAITRAAVPMERTLVINALGEFLKGPIVPLVGPPRQLKINGKLADARRELTTGATTEPQIEWMPPQKGEPDGYLLWILPQKKGSTIIALPKSARSFKVPAGLLAAGDTYSIRVSAVSQPCGFAEHPFRTCVPYGRGDTVTEPLEP